MNNKLYNIHDPKINFVQTYKQLLLLTDHLGCPKMWCILCVHKHLSTAVSLLEEAKSLDKEKKYVRVLDIMIEEISKYITEIEQYNSNGIFIPDALKHDLDGMARHMRKFIQSNIILSRPSQSKLRR